MDSRNIKSILQEALEGEIPSSKVDLLPAVQSRLVAGKESSHQQGDRMNKTFIGRLAYSAITVMVLLFAILITPQGRAFAQSIFQFFVRADQDRYPLQSWQMTPPAQTSTDSPFKLSVQEAESLAGYDVLSPVDIPSGMVFVGASYDKKYHVVSEAFGQGADYIELSIWQQPLEYYQPCGDIHQLCDNMLGMSFVGASASLETVQVGSFTGEYLEGVWALTDNGPVWNPTPYSKTLRWKTDTMILELVYNGIDLDRDVLVGLAGSIR